MRFLADECCDFAAVRSLRAQGHDVLAVSDFQQRSVDQDVMELALAENRILLTEDKDFGWLVFAGHVNALRALAACEAAAGSEPVLMALRDWSPAPLGVFDGAPLGPHVILLLNRPLNGTLHG
jgi:hypothetical protein